MHTICANEVSLPRLHSFVENNKRGPREMTTPPATIIIPCYNAERWVGRAIESLLNQSIANLQVVIVDDGSTDASLGVIRQYESRVEIVTGPNCGAPAARNRGLEQASAPFVMFLDADDYMEPSSLDCWLRDAIEADLVLGPFARELNGVRSKGAAPARPLSVSSLLVDWAAGRFTPPCAALWRTAYVRSIGGWAEDLRRNQDGELVVRAILNGARVKTSSSGLGVYVQHDQAPRISRRKDRRSIESELLAFRRIASAAAKDDHDVSEIIGQFFYSIARSAYKEEFCDLGDAALRDARKLGFKRHLGTKSHILISRLMGLPAKTRLSQALGKKFCHPQYWHGEEPGRLIAD